MRNELVGTVTTPALVVDVEVLERNIARMAETGRTAGFALRPHAKTHKCPQIARRQLAAGATGLTVATIGEAEVFAAAGADDLFIGYPLWADEGKARRLRALADRTALRLAADSAAGARRLGEAVRGADRPVQLLVEIDSGHHRTGVRPADAVEVARAAADAGLDVAGVFTFPGHGYGHDAQARERAARDEERALGEAAEALRSAGLDVRVVSGGSTPTAGRWRPDGPVDELRPGVYVFNDAAQLAMGSCAAADIALYALATVVSVPAPDRFVLDAGSKVIGADTTPWVSGHGHLPDFPGAAVTALSEHHATVTLPAGTAAPGLGSLVAVVPNHVCAAVNLVDELVVVDGTGVVDRWPVAARGANG
ncbi:alanine racemase [Streptantibioticus cattleyicolor]|uniref:Alanine racemase N-terminal domain-containing protein n=1 Tax=Streptantibioticus cattleyicolor (strain ATCC 35852 / DSM 46488 / JCM 4925 / NBRC 14057 / NRRL 8057) TaxID=1003195 RepID=F8JIY7_STREN|nr:alanine racemase [Streptantibioticus cattleyicolor]AEW98927.1 alanine racemase N-terminal domain-containing protein [Streptantibioticus cattleyicolor NRRL 8057 = DSM 46488]CCB72027.1 Predicted amino acid aldolase or racemase [Streptantibioticus cattleyicolor NRRL 8057 = DSM 46488]